jgi:hypothetical protein
MTVQDLICTDLKGGFTPAFPDGVVVSGHRASVHQ